MGAKVGELVLVGVTLGSGVPVAVAVGGMVGVAVGRKVDCVAQPARRTAAKKIKIRRWIFIIFSKCGRFIKSYIRASLLITRNGVTLKFIPNFREVITGIIQPAGIVTGMSVIATPIIETILGFAMHIFASVGAIVGMMVNDIIDQASIKNLREDRV